MTEYTRPELTAEETKQTEDYARWMLRKHGMANMVVLVAMLAVENARLLKECNDHRAARNIELLPVVKVQ